MSVTFVKQSASPYALKYIIGSSAGSGETGSLTAAQLIADCAAGPLKTQLQSANGGVVPWAGLEKSVYVTVLSAPQSGPGLSICTFLNGPNTFQASAQVAIGSSLVEIRFRPSVER